MRKKFVAGNWKMHGTCKSVADLLGAINEGAHDLTGIDVAVFPTFVHLSLAKELADPSVAVGAQTLHTGEFGAFTGEVSGPMLTDLGCRYVLIGHSERRIVFGENLSQVAAKFKAALDYGLTPILCVGETLKQREEGATEAVIAEQIGTVLDLVGIDAFTQALIAYEPVWAIGTGLTATPEQAQAVHAFIRQHLAQKNVDVASALRILYGGSVKADNAKGLFAMPDIDGGLIGGASLDAKGFVEICRAANRCTN